MRVLIDGRGIMNELDGIGRYSVNLIRSLVARDGGISYRILIREGLDEATRSRLPDGVELIPVPFSHIAPKTLYALGRTVDALAPDLYHSLFMFQPLIQSAPAIITVHDTMWLRRPWLQSAFRPLETGLGWAYFRGGVALSIRKAARVVTPSEATRRDLVETFGAASSKTSVIYEGADEFLDRPRDEARDRSVLAELGLAGRPYFLHVTNAKPYKNTPRVLRAFAKAHQDTGTTLVLVGRRSAFTGATEKLVARLGIGEKIVLAGSVSEDALAALMRQALALVFPSLYEGFGLPIVEAMACGCPVLTSDRGSMAEVAGDAALLVDPTDVDAIAAAFVRLAREEALRRTLGAQGLTRSRRFRWDAAAGEVVALYHEISGA